MKIAFDPIKYNAKATWLPKREGPSLTAYFVWAYLREEKSENARMSEYWDGRIIR